MATKKELLAKYKNMSLEELIAVENLIPSDPPEPVNYGVLKVGYNEVLIQPGDLDTIMKIMGRAEGLTNSYSEPIVIKPLEKDFISMFFISKESYLKGKVLNLLISKNAQPESSEE